MMNRGICLLLAKSRTHPAAIPSVLYLVSAIALSLFLSLAQTQPTHSSFVLMGCKVSLKWETLKASAGDDGQRIWRFLSFTSHCHHLKQH